jgi:hypothetical protein
MLVNRVVRGACATLDRIGGVSIAERKRAASGKDGKAGQKDMLSLLFRANTAADVGAHLSDADVRADPHLPARGARDNINRRGMGALRGRVGPSRAD